jgi:hypothetical protein
MSNIARFDGLRVVSYLSITSSYTPFGLPLDHSMRLLDFQNDTDALIYLSFDGVNDNIAMTPGGSFRIYDVTADQDTNEKFRYQRGTQVMLKYVGSAPTNNATLTNNCYMTALYGKGE